MTERIQGHSRWKKYKIIRKFACNSTDNMVNYLSYYGRSSGNDCATNALEGRRIQMDILRSITEEYKKNDIPAFRPGDTVQVHVKVVEGTRERIQVFEGVVIKIKGGGV